MTWVVYLLRCADDTLYTGITNNFEKRLSAHEQGLGAKYTRGRGPFELLYSEEVDDRAAATRRELEIKGLTRLEKLKLGEKR